ncbi:unnamed protein product [Rotaria sordida]|uniref:Uncharacterized protein n=1 Tax=Rotaria sordida TaxID=392033 RepID=A0A813V9W9_9BILA|nr:unnamed protein product [Rotaria sordida]CAF0857523.1 unnamed protein product [Rotaria sordida]
MIFILLTTTLSTTRSQQLPNITKDNIRFDSLVFVKEAREYYIKELDGESTSQWAIVECIPDDPKKNTLRARISHNNKTADTVYTFSPADKIQRIDVVN